MNKDLAVFYPAAPQYQRVSKSKLHQKQLDKTLEHIDKLKQAKRRQDDLKKDQHGRLNDNRRASTVLQSNSITKNMLKKSDKEKGRSLMSKPKPYHGIKHGDQFYARLNVRPPATQQQS